MGHPGASRRSTPTPVYTTSSTLPDGDEKVKNQYSPEAEQLSGCSLSPGYGGLKHGNELWRNAVVYSFKFETEW